VGWVPKGGEGCDRATVTILGHWRRPHHRPAVGLMLAAWGTAVGWETGDKRWRG